MSNAKEKSRNRSRSTNNPYLTAPARAETTRVTLGSELKRLTGLPYRLPATLALVVAPLLLTIAGGLDLATGWLYTVAHHTTQDTRPTISLFDCLAEQSKKMCSDLVWASPASPKRLALYPWHGVKFLEQFEPGLFLAFFALAVLSFSAIGSPNAIRIGRVLLSIFKNNKKSVQTAVNQELGLEVKKPEKKNKKGRSKDDNGRNQEGGSKEEKLPEELGVIPALKIDAEPESFVKVWQSSLILGGYLPRIWESDPGYFYLDREVQPVPYWLTLNMLRTNLVIVAPQGSGKTYSVYRPLLTFMRRSHSVAIFWDSKGDDFNPAYFDYNFDPENPAVSIKLNIFAGQSPAQAGERLAEALIPDLGGDKQYFSNNAKDAMAALVAAHNIVYKRNPKLVDLLNYLTEPQKVLSLHDTVLEDQRGPERYEEALRMATLLRRVLQLAENKNTDVLGSLATALNPLVTGSASRVLVTNPDDDDGEAYTIEELIRKPGLIHLSLPVAKSPRLAPILGRLILAQFTYAVLSPDCNRQLFKMAAVDEARHFITENVANGMAQARSNNAGYVLALQTLTQIKDESLLDTIFAVSGTKIVMAGVGEKDARRFSDTFGQLELPYVNHSQGQSKGTSHNHGSSYSRGQEYEFFGGRTGSETRSSRNTSHGRGQTSSQNTNSLISTRVRPRFFPAEIRELNQFLAVVESSDAEGHRWFAQVINMRSSTVNRLENRVLDQLKRLRDLQEQASPSHKGSNGTKSNRPHSGQPPEQIQQQEINTNTRVGSENDGVEKHSETAEKHVLGHQIKTAEPKKAERVAFRFLPADPGTTSAESKGVVTDKESSYLEQNLTSHQTGDSRNQPGEERPGIENGGKGLPPVTVKTEAADQMPTQALAEPQPAIQQDNQPPNKKKKLLLREEAEEQLVQASFLDSVVPTHDLETNANTNTSTAKVVPVPESEGNQVPEPKKPHKRRVSRDKTSPVPEITPVSEIASIPAAKKAKDPAGLL